METEYQGSWRSPSPVCEHARTLACHTRLPSPWPAAEHARIHAHAHAHARAHACRRSTSRQPIHPVLPLQGNFFSESKRHRERDRVCVRSCLSYRVSVCVRARACVCRCLCTCIIFLETLQSTGIECIHACTPACMHTYMHGEQGANLDFS